MKPNKAVAVIVAVSIAAAGTSALAFGKMRGEGERGSRGEMRFEQLDTDKDGFLSKDEMRKMRKMGKRNDHGKKSY